VLGGALLGRLVSHSQRKVPLPKPAIGSAGASKVEVTNGTAEREMPILSDVCLADSLPAPIWNVDNGGGISNGEWGGLLSHGPVTESDSDRARTLRIEFIPVYNFSRSSEVVSRSL